MQKRFSMGESEISFLADKAGATQIELVYMPEGAKAEAQGVTVCFQTDELEDIHRRALEWNLNPSEIRMPDDTMRYFYVYDPDGISIEFKELR
jgi:lactoylglutathione lyase